LPWGGRSAGPGATMPRWTHRRSCRKLWRTCRRLLLQATLLVERGQDPLRSCCGVTPAIQARREARRMHRGLVEPEAVRRLVLAELGPLPPRPVPLPEVIGLVLA